MYTALDNLRSATQKLGWVVSQRLRWVAATATYAEPFPRAGLIRCIADVNAAAEIVRKKAGITCDEIADAEAEALERMERDGF